jgi:hypothetical protein
MLGRKRLVMVLGMLGSDHAGERDNAARLVVRMLKEAGLTWPQLLDGERVATEATRVLLAENEQLQVENRNGRRSWRGCATRPCQSSGHCRAPLVSRSRRQSNGPRSSPIGSANSSPTCTAR